MCTAIFCVSVPATRPLLLKFAPGLLSSGPRSSSYDRYGEKLRAQSHAHAHGTPSASARYIWTGQRGFRGDDPFDNATLGLQDECRAASASASRSEAENEIENGNEIVVTHSVSVTVQERPLSGGDLALVSMDAGGVGQDAQRIGKKKRFWKARGLPASVTSSSLDGWGSGGHQRLDESESESV
jgi:hypothetical protein